MGSKWWIVRGIESFKLALDAIRSKQYRVANSYMKNAKMCFDFAESYQALGE